MRSPKAITIAADGVGAVSTLLGGILAIAPNAGGRALGVAGTSQRCKRALGIADLGLGVAILASRSRRWRWSAVAARSLLHLGFAQQYARNGRPAASAAMCALFFIDAGVSATLRLDSRLSTSASGAAARAT